MTQSVLNVPLVNDLKPELLEKGLVHRLHLRMVCDGLGQMLTLPVMVCRGYKDGPTLGITAAIHGNELNGTFAIQGFLKTFKPKRLAGTIILVPVVNVPGFLSNTRTFNDGKDLNRVMPGKKRGTCSEVYAYRLINKVVKKFDYLIDLHTASFGRANSLYVRADLTHPKASRLAQLQHTQIICHKVQNDKTLRAAAMKHGIPTITVEIGNPNRHQRKLVKSTYAGFLNVMHELGMYPSPSEQPRNKPIICDKSFWIYTDTGGLLEVFPEVAQKVKKGELVARVKNVFGDIQAEYFSPEDGIVIGKSTNPVNQTGSRVLHLGIIRKQKQKET